MACSSIYSHGRLLVKNLLNKILKKLDVLFMLIDRQQECVSENFFSNSEKFFFCDFCRKKLWEQRMNRKKKSQKWPLESKVCFVVFAKLSKNFRNEIFFRNCCSVWRLFLDSFAKAPMFKAFVHCSGKICIFLENFFVNPRFGSLLSTGLEDRKQKLTFLHLNKNFCFLLFEFRNGISICKWKLKMSPWRNFGERNCLPFLMNRNFVSG